MAWKAIGGTIDIDIVGKEEHNVVPLKFLSYGFRNWAAIKDFVVLDSTYLGREVESLPGTTRADIIHS